MFTSDHVEIHVCLWQGTSHSPAQNNTDSGEYSSIPSTIVEIQRRKGCPIRYHRYCRQLLDAANGDFPEQGRIDPDQLLFSKQILKIKESEDWQNAQTNILLALDIAASLLKKDRMDARELGMESLCLLTDPTKTGFHTALIASRAVLLGSYEVESESSNESHHPLMTMNCGIREAVLSLIQLCRLSDHGEYKDDCLNPGAISDEESDLALHPEEREHYYLLHNLALNVLSNALDVLQHAEEKESIEYNSSGDGSLSKVPSVQDVFDPASSTIVTNQFLKDSSEISQKELISTLLGVLGQAASKPHNACLSARCLRHLFQASITARRRARELNAKQIVSTALDVGRRTHAKLEVEAEKVKHELMQSEEDDEDSEVDE